IEGEYVPNAVCYLPFGRTCSWQRTFWYLTNALSEYFPTSEYSMDQGLNQDMEVSGSPSFRGNGGTGFPRLGASAQRRELKVLASNARWGTGRGQAIAP